MLENHSINNHKKKFQGTVLIKDSQVATCESRITDLKTFLIKKMVSWFSSFLSI